jgi:CheY-like chemotaxis protein
MTGRVVRTNLEVADDEAIVRRVEVIDGRQLAVQREAERPRLLRRAFVQEQIVAVQADGHAEDRLGARHPGDVIDVRVRQEDVRDGDSLAGDVREQTVDLIAWIDVHALLRARAGDDEAVLLERTLRLRLDYDHRVILAILDDLMFTSKIRAAAKPLGLTVQVARTRDAALAEMRTTSPSLVIFDLNNPRTDPLGIVAAMKADAALAGIRTIGFVSHVQTDVIEASRRAGVGDVMARSAFSERIGEILGREIQN